MKTAAPSAAASAAFCCARTLAVPAPEVDREARDGDEQCEHDREPDEDETVLAFAAALPAAPESGEAAAGAHQVDEHTALGVGSNRNTLWSVECDRRAEDVRHEVVSDLDVDADLVERLGQTCWVEAAQPPPWGVAC